MKMHTNQSAGKMHPEGSVCPYVAGTVTRYCTLTPFTLTDAEREAIVTALAFLREEADEPGVAQDAATLRGLLERTDAQNI